MNNWRTYRVAIPRFYVEYMIPPVLVTGYGPQRAEVLFDDSDKDDVYALGADAFQLDVATFFYGVVGDFRDWDMRVMPFIVRFNKATIKSTSDLAEYIQKEFSKKKLTTNGKEINSLGEVKMLRIGSFDVVVATAADMYHIKDLELRDGREVTLLPYQQYFIRLDDQMVFGLRVFHDNQKRLNPKWHADAKALAISIIENLKFISNSDNQ